MLALGWHPELLQHRSAYPIITLVQDVGMTGANLLSAFELDYTALDRWGVTAEELVALDLRGPLLRHIGMRGEHVADALLHPHVAVRGGAPWLCAALHITPALFSDLTTDRQLIANNRQLQGAYASLTMHLASGAAPRRP